MTSINNGLIILTSSVITITYLGYIIPFLEDIYDILLSTLWLTLVVCCSNLIYSKLPFSIIKNKVLNRIVVIMFFLSGLFLVVLNKNFSEFNNYVLSFMLAVFFLSTLSFLVAHFRSESRSEVTNNLFLLLTLIGVILLGFCLRIWGLGDNSLWVDEIWHTYSSHLGLEDGGIINTITFYDNARLATFITYIASFFFGFENEFLLRLPFALIGTFLIALAFLVGKEYKNNLTGIYFSLLLSLSPLFILYSREIRFYVLILLFTLLMMLFYYKYRNSNRIEYLYYLFFVCVISVISVPYYHLIILPFLFLPNVLQLLSKYRFQLKRFIPLLFLSCAALIFFLVYEFRWIFLKETTNLSKLYYTNQFMIYEFVFLLLIILAFSKIYRRSWNIIVMIVSIVFLLSFATIQEERYILFLFPFFYLLVADAFNESSVNLKSWVAFSIIFLVAVFNLSNFYLYSRDFSLSESIHFRITELNIFSLYSYINQNEKIIRAKSPILKPNYRDSMVFIKNNYDPRETIIIAESFESVRYYNSINNYGFLIAHPYWDWYRIHTHIKSRENVCAIVGHRISLNLNSQVSQETISYINNDLLPQYQTQGLEVRCTQ